MQPSKADFDPFHHLAPTDRSSFLEVYVYIIMYRAHPFFYLPVPLKASRQSATTTDWPTITSTSPCRRQRGHAVAAAAARAPRSTSRCPLARARVHTPKRTRSRTIDSTHNVHRSERNGTERSSSAAEQRA